MWQEFKAFLIKDNVIGLAIAVILGGTLNKLVTAFVDHMIMPIVGMVTQGGAWEAWKVGPFGVGQVLAALINFLVIGFVCWRISKAFVKEPAK